MSILEEICINQMNNDALYFNPDKKIVLEAQNFVCDVTVSIKYCIFIMVKKCPETLLPCSLLSKYLSDFLSLDNTLSDFLVVFFNDFYFSVTFYIAQ